jgi:hypothetical protein
MPNGTKARYNRSFGRKRASQQDWSTEKVKIERIDRTPNT